MITQPSAFQMQYPLSPRKFWKKLLPSITKYIFLGIAIYAIPAIVFYTAELSQGVPEIWSWFTYLVPITALVILIIIFLRVWYIKVYIKRYYYDCGEQFITIKKGVFAPTEIHVQYQKIQDVYVDQDILDRIMGLYDVHIASATITSGIEAHIDGVNAEVAENLKNIILEKIRGVGTPSSSAQTPVSQSVPQSNPVQFGQKISSETYPMGGAWVVHALWSSLVYSFIYSLVLWRFLPLSLFYNAVVFGIIFFLHVIWQSIWKQNFYFEFTPDYIVLRTGVISRQEEHLPYKSIQNILNKQSILDRVLGLSTVVIQNAAQQMVGKGQVVESGIALIWQPKAKAEALNAVLNDIVSKVNPQNSRAMGV